MYVTYQDLIQIGIQIGIFMVSIVNLCYTVFKGKREIIVIKIPAATANNDGCLIKEEK